MTKDPVTGNEMEAAPLEAKIGAKVQVKLEGGFWYDGTVDRFKNDGERSAVHSRALPRIPGCFA